MAVDKIKVSGDPRIEQRSAFVRGKTYGMRLILDSCQLMLFDISKYEILFYTASMACHSSQFGLANHIFQVTCTAHLSRGSIKGL
jgi:hypothetical protein